MRRRGYWLGFALGATTAVGGMAWVTLHVSELDRAERALRAEAAHQERVRLALWRMDAWLGARLAPEAARPWFDYGGFDPIAGHPGAANGTPSRAAPLAAYRSPLFVLHFQVDATGRVTSPQLPDGADRPSEGQEGAEPRPGATDPGGVRDRHLAAVRRALEQQDVAARLTAASPRAVFGADVALDPDLHGRVAHTFQNNVVQQWQTWTHAGFDAVTGPLQPLWLGEQLALVRRVDVGGRTLHQGFTVDRPTLERLLRDQAADLFAVESVRFSAEAAGAADPHPHRLATVPLRLAVPEPALPAAGAGALTGVLGVAWGALFLAIVAVGATLAAALAFGARRARFASALTHELRSPLTTFRMYAEMLAEGMVQEAAQRADYLATLCRESDRLARLVENVLAYARIEKRRVRGRDRSVALGDLLERVAPMLESRARTAGLELELAVADPAVPVRADPDAVEQILFGLCDNACKYAAAGPVKRLAITAGRRGKWAEIRVRDHGGGIPARYRRSVFRPFDRGSRAPGDSVEPGVGLGLALARGLARENGGDVGLEPRTSDGACFVLTLPVARVP